MKTLDEIAAMYFDRFKLYGPLHNTMRAVRDTYNGDVNLPVPELNLNEKATVANMLRTGLDQVAERTASTTPNIFCPAVKEGFKGSEEKARQRRRAYFGWWGANKMRNQLYRRARWLHGYALAPVSLLPDFKQKIPRWQPRDPMSCFPAPGLDVDEIHPPDCIFTFNRSLSYLRQNYPDVIGRVARKDDSPTTQFVFLEYVDEYEHVLLVLGRQNRDAPPAQNTPEAFLGRQLQKGQTDSPPVELERFDNRAGMTTVVIPRRVTLDREVGKFDTLVNMFVKQARLMALEEIAVERGIFADPWLESNPQEEAEIIQQADGKTGKVGVVKGGKLHFDRPPPDMAALQAIDRLERAQRVEGGVPAEFGGESTTNVRTGRRGDSILSAVVDFPIQEAQVMLAESLQIENKIGVAIDKGYFGNKPKSTYVSWKGASGRLEYTPKNLWETDENYVSYAHAGADTNGLVIGGGQRIGQGTMSKETFMEIDPLIDDPEKERNRVVTEGLQAAMLQGIQQQAAGGQIPPADVARITDLVTQKDMSLADAITKAHEEMQQRQAKEAPPSAPEAQPGMAQPGAGAEAGQAIAGPNASQKGLADLLNNLRRPQRGLPQEGAPTGVNPNQGGENVGAAQGSAA